MTNQQNTPTKNKADETAAKTMAELLIENKDKVMDSRKAAEEKKGDAATGRDVIEVYETNEAGPEWLEQISDLYESISKAAGPAPEIQKAIADLMNAIKPIQEQAAMMQQMMQQTILPNKKAIQQAEDNMKAVRELYPYLEEELADKKKTRPDLKELDLNQLSVPKFLACIRGKGSGIWAEIVQGAIARKEKQEAIENLPQIQSKFPDKWTSPNTRVSNKLEVLLQAGEPGDLPVYNIDRTNEICVFVGVSYAEGVDLPQNYSLFDRAVHDAVCALWEYGDRSHVFTADMLIRAMTGSPSLRPSKRMREAVIKSLEKQMQILVKVDATEEIKAAIKRKGQEPPRGYSYKRGGNILSLDILESRNGNQVIPAYWIKGEPILLNYAKQTGKIITTNIEVLDIKEVDDKGRITGNIIPNTDNHLTMKTYLWRRVATMQYDQRQAEDALRKYNRRQKKENPARDLSSFFKVSRTIRFDKVFEKVGIATSNRRTLKQNRDYIFQVMKYWKAKGEIADYKTQKGEKNAITGVTIII